MDKFSAYLISNPILTELVSSFSSKEITRCNINNDMSERLIVFSTKFAPEENYV